MEGKLKISFIGDSHIAYWPFESYFPKWECYNYGVPGKGLDYVEMFHKDVRIVMWLFNWGLMIFII